MIDDAGLGEVTSHRARGRVFMLAAVSLAALALPACADESPPDDALAADLSAREVVALCDELRDAVESSPPRCPSDAAWAQSLPSNHGCLTADLSACTVTVGELRRCNDRALRAPCLFVDDGLAPVSETETADVDECQRMPACEPFLPLF